MSFTYLADPDSETCEPYEFEGEEAEDEIEEDSDDKDEVAAIGKRAV